MERLIIQPPFRYPAIFQDEACFLHFKSGAIRLTSASEKSTSLSSESLLLQCGTYFAELLQHSDEATMEVIAVHFHLDLFQEIYRFDTIPTLQNSPKKSHVRRVENTPLVFHYMESLNFYFSNPQIVSEELLILKIKELVLLLLETKEAETLVELLADLFTPRKEALKKIVQTHLYTPINVSEMAHLAGMSLSSFNREFQKAYHDTPANFLRSKKMEKARELLEHTDKTIAEISLEVGLSDSSHFTKLYKNFFGSPPSAFKKS